MEAIQIFDEKKIVERLNNAGDSEAIRYIKFLRIINRQYRERISDLQEAS